MSIFATSNDGNKFFYQFAVAACLVVLLASIAYTASASIVREHEKGSEYECGFSPFDAAARLPFDVQFYLVGILFLIFDVEIALLFPWIETVGNVGWKGCWNTYGFIIFLAIIFCYEWQLGALSWPRSSRVAVTLSRQNNYFKLPGGAATIKFKFNESDLENKPARPFAKFYSGIVTGCGAYHGGFARGCVVPVKKYNEIAECIRVLDEEFEKSHHLYFIRPYFEKMALWWAANRCIHLQTFNHDYRRYGNGAQLCKRLSKTGAEWAFDFTVKDVENYRQFLFLIPGCIFNDQVLEGVVAMFQRFRAYDPRFWLLTPSGLALLTLSCGISFRGLSELNFIIFWFIIELYRIARFLKCAPQLHFFASNRLLSALWTAASMGYFGAITTFRSIYDSGWICGTNEYVFFSPYTSCLHLTISFTTFFALLFSVRYIAHYGSASPVELSAAIMTTALFCFTLVSATHLVLASLSIAGFSLTLYVLCYCGIASPAAREAGIKYFYLSSASSGLMLCGIFLIIVATQFSSLTELGTAFYFCTYLSAAFQRAINFGVTVFLVGLSFKLAAFPGHLWAADVYEGTSDHLTFLFMTVTKLSVIAFLTHMLFIGFENNISSWQLTVLGLSISSLLWGCFAALNEYKIKRFLAYTSINQVGFALGGLAGANFGSCAAAVFYFWLYVLTTVSFFIAINVIFSTKKNAESLRYLTEFVLLPMEAHRYWYQTFAAVILTYAFSSAGIPPLLGFFGKYYLFIAVQGQHLYGFLSVALFTSLLSAFYYMRLIKILWFEPRPRFYYAPAFKRAFSALPLVYSTYQKLLDVVFISFFWLAGGLTLIAHFDTLWVFALLWALPKASQHVNKNVQTNLARQVEQCTALVPVAGNKISRWRQIPARLRSILLRLRNWYPRSILGVVLEVVTCCVSKVLGWRWPRVATRLTSIKSSFMRHMVAVAIVAFLLWLYCGGWSWLFTMFTAFTKAFYKVHREESAHRAWKVEKARKAEEIKNIQFDPTELITTFTPWPPKAKNKIPTHAAARDQMEGNSSTDVKPNNNKSNKKWNPRLDPTTDLIITALIAGTVFVIIQILGGGPW